MTTTADVLRAMEGAFALGSGGNPLPDCVVSKALLDSHTKGLLARLDFLESIQAEGGRLLGTPATDPRDITR
jgi:hypothetical protein